MNELVLRPSYWANVSGGKDSLYMLKLILSNQDHFPLDGVVHFELEIDFPFIHDVIDYMESECKKYKIPFVRIRPRHTWEELYYKKTKSGTIRGFPTRVVRWCNNEYKLDALRQLEAFVKSQGKYAVNYIGYCADEEKRFIKRKKREIYPLVQYGIEESQILEWAKTVNVFNKYYITNRRCGCMYCPLADRMQMAYLLKYYPKKFTYMIEKMKETEIVMEQKTGEPFSVIDKNPRYNADYLEDVIKRKWIPRLEEKERLYFGGDHND